MTNELLNIPHSERLRGLQGESPEIATVAPYIGLCRRIILMRVGPMCPISLSSITHSREVVLTNYTNGFVP